MSNHSSLARLAQRLSQLEQAISHIGQKNAPKARFDRHLFVSHGTRLNDYVAEVRSNFCRLQQEVAQNHPLQVDFLAQRILDQISALQREQATLALRHYDEVAAEKTATPLYRRLGEHREYERRLQQMIDDREARRRQNPRLSASLQRELAVLEGRLQRCRQALKKIENHIERNPSVE